jgi:hypothetical protein
VWSLGSGADFPKQLIEQAPGASHAPFKSGVWIDALRLLSFIIKKSARHVLAAGADVYQRIVLIGGTLKQHEQDYQSLKGRKTLLAMGAPRYHYQRALKDLNDKWCNLPSAAYWAAFVLYGV